MAIELNKFVKGKHLKPADFNLDDPTNLVSVKTDAASAVGTAIAAATPAASATVSGITRYATNEETRLGATDANKTTTAVTPDDMSYTLQTGKEYPTWMTGFRVIGGVNFGSRRDIADISSGPSYGIASYFFGGTAVGINNYAVTGSVTSAVTAPSGTIVVGMFGASDASGIGDKRGVAGRAIGTGGTNVGVYGAASNGATNWAGFFDGNISATSYVTASDATLKEDVQDVDATKALAFSNGLKWKRYEFFSEEQVEIMEDVEVDGETTQKPTGRYEVKRHSQGRKYGLIAQDVQALTAQIGDFQDVVVKIGEYFDLDANGYPKKDAKGNVIKKDRFGLDYDAIQVVILAGEQAAFSPAGRNK